MGNSKFFFSVMIQNSWFYKLKYMSKTKNQKSMQKSTITKNQLNTKSPPPHATTHAPPQPHHLCQQRKSYHFTRDLINTPHPPSPNSTNSASQLPNTPTKPSKTRKSIKKQMIPSCRASSVSTHTSFGINVESVSVWTKPDSTPDDYPPDNSSSEDDNASIFPSIVPKNGDFNLVPQVELPTIVTKKITTSNKTEEARKNIKSPVRKVTVKLRTNSPRLIASKRYAHVNGRESVSTSGAKRRSLSESLAVMKLSRDPYKDFKESMVEMIMVNNMKTPKDLEDLLTCYLSLNSDKYHDVIIKVFKQIWLETINDIKLFK